MYLIINTAVDLVLPSQNGCICHIPDVNFDIFRNQLRITSATLELSDFAAAISFVQNADDATLQRLLNYYHRLKAND